VDSTRGARPIVLLDEVRAEPTAPTTRKGLAYFVVLAARTALSLVKAGECQPQADRCRRWSRRERLRDPCGRTNWQHMRLADNTYDGLDNTSDNT
jgi:hypothetical protein